MSREILDSRGMPTVESKVVLDDGYYGISSCPTGASTGKYESVEIRDKDVKRYTGLGVLQAVSNIENVIRPKLVGMEASNQQELDQALITLDGTENKKKLGVNSILPVSMAVAKAQSASQRIPLYYYLGKIFQKTESPKFHIPTPIFNVMNGGKHGAGNLEFQEFWVIPSQTKPYSQALQMGVEIYFAVKKVLIYKSAIHSVGDEGGFAPNLYTNADALEILVEAITQTQYELAHDVFLGLDLAANHFKSGSAYQIKDRSNSMNAAELVEFYKELIERYKLLAIEDPLGEDDFKDWTYLNSQLGNRVMVVGDDLLVTNPKRLERAIKEKACNAILAKPNQIGTISETFEVLEKSNANDFKVIISHRSGETNDSFIADLAVAVNADYVKFGAPARGERVAKYNRLLEIAISLVKSKPVQAQQVQK